MLIDALAQYYSTSPAHCCATFKQAFIYLFFPTIGLSVRNRASRLVYPTHRHLLYQLDTGSAPRGIGSIGVILVIALTTSPYLVIIFWGVAKHASLSAVSFPGISRWLGIPMSSIVLALTGRSSSEIAVDFREVFGGSVVPMVFWGVYRGPADPQNAGGF